jgi:para-nitrobenzyl esterase
MVARLPSRGIGRPTDRDSIKADVPLDKLVQAASDLVVEVRNAWIPRWGQLTLSLLPFAPTVDGSVLPARPPLASFSPRAGRAFRC